MCPFVPPQACPGVKLWIQDRWNWLKWLAFSSQQVNQRDDQDPLLNKALSCIVAQHLNSICNTIPVEKTVFSFIIYIYIRVKSIQYLESRLFNYIILYSHRFCFYSVPCCWKIWSVVSRLEYFFACVQGQGHNCCVKVICPQCF